MGESPPLALSRSFPVPTANSRPNGITAGPDGNLWFTEYSGNKIVQISGFLPPGNTNTLFVATGTLTGSVTDDGLPIGATLTTTWSQSSGPGPVSFASPTATFPDVAGQANPVVTLANFRAAGTYTLTLTGSDSQLSNSSSVTVTVNPPPIVSVNQNTGSQGQQNLPVTITGEFTHFVQGTTTASFGAGITLALPLTVNSATSATAVLNIDPTAVVGARTVTLTTNTEVATLANGFSVSGAPVLTQINPSTGQQGQQNFSVGITGQNTHFVQGTTQVSFGPDIAVGTVTVASATSLTAQITIAVSAAVGARPVTVTTGAEVESLVNGFAVTAGTPVLLSVDPNISPPSGTMLVTLTGQFTHFLQGTTQASFGDAISVGGGPVGGFGPVTVISPTIATSQVHVICAFPGPRTVVVQTGSESVAKNGGFSTTTATPSPVLFSEYPGPTTPTFSDGSLEDITCGPDGNLWFTESYAFGAQTQIGRITTAGVLTLFSVPSGSGEKGIKVGPDGNLWFTEYRSQKIGSITTAGVFTEFSVPGAGYPVDLTVGPDGNLWFTEYLGNQIGRITPAGIVTEFPVPTANSRPNGITAGPDGNLWFTENIGNKIGRITPAGVFTEFPVLTPSSGMEGITGGPDGNLWFAEDGANKIGRINPAGVITEFLIPTSGSRPRRIGLGPDGNLWFTENGGNQIGRITPAGVITEYLVPTPSSTPFGITAGPDGNLWFTEHHGNKIGKFSINFTGPTLLSINPNTAQQGRQHLLVTITGQSTNFLQGTSLVSFGAGITVNNPITVLSATSLTADISVDANAPVGARTITVTTGAEVESLTNGFLVTGASPATITTVSPNSGPQGQGGPVGIVGQNTHFVQGTTQVDFGAGISVSNVSVTCATCLTVQVQIAATAVLGARTVTVTTGSEVVSLPNGFTVVAGTPILTSMNPASGRQGQTVTSTITGLFTNWVQGPTTVNLGAGITVNAITVTNPTTLTVQLAVAFNATLGIRNITVTTGAEIVSSTNVFTVLAGSPVLTQVSPNTGPQGQINLAVSITGQFTNFVQGTTQVDFGAGITINSVTVTNATSLSANISVALAANTGARTITVTTGSETAVLANGFTVTSASTPILLSATPNSGVQGQPNLSVALVGQLTDWVQGTTTASFGANITVASLTANSSTGATAVVNIGTAATTGARTIALTTGSEIDTLNNGFTVNPATGTNQPPVVSAGPNQTILLGANLLVNPGADAPLVNGAIPGWTVASGNWTQATAGTSTFPLSTDGNTYFYAGQAASAELYQDVDVSNFAAAIDAGQQQLELKAQMYVLAESTPDSGRVQFDFLDATKNFVIASSFFQSAGSGNIWTPAAHTRLAPAQTRWVRVRLIATMNTGPSNDAYFDSISLRALSAGAFLSGTATDDGLPVGSTLSTNWSLVSNPGTVTFAKPNAPATAASFSATGVYVLQLTGNDTQLSASSNVTITVNPGNQPPFVDAGPDLAITLPATATLAGIATDDGLPLNAPLAVSWGVVSGPGSVTFNPPASANTTASFMNPGTYLLRLTASDSQYAVHSYVTVIVISTITSPPPTVVIASPIEGTVVTSPVNVVGTVTSSTLANWKLEIGRPDLPTRTLLASGTTAVNNSTLGTLDPTLLLNGQSQLFLTASDTAGQTAILKVNVVIDRNEKVGNFSVSFNDLTVPLAGIPIDIVRTYDSRDQRKGDFGIGWQLAIKSPQVQKASALGAEWVGTATNTCFTCIPVYCIEPVMSKLVTITFPDGKVFRFEPDLLRTDTLQSVRCTQAVPPLDLTVQFAFTPQPGTNATLAAIGSNQVFVNGSFPGPIELLDANTYTSIWDTERFRLVLQDGRAFEFNGLAGLQSLTDLNGNNLTITSSGITHSSGKSVVFSRDNIGRITQITDPAGNSISYTYNLLGDLVTFKDRENNTTTYTYNSTHGLLTIQDPRGINPIRNVYDNAGRLVQNIDAFGKVINYTHNIGTRQEIITDRLNNITLHEYDDHGNVVRTTDPLGGVTQRTYDSLDNLLSETDPLGRMRTYTYDAHDNRLTEKDALGNTTAYTYNSRGQVLTITDPLGRATTNAYDSAGNLASTRDPLGNVTSYTYNTAGLRTSSTDPLNNVTTYLYDGSGNLTHQVDPNGHAMDYTYDPNGNRLRQTTTRTTSLGSETLVTSYQYDKLNRLVKTTYPDGSTTQTVYNSIGKQSSTVDQLNHQTSYQYDDLGRLAQTIYPDGTNESSTYDAEGRRASATDRGGRLTSFQYDATGRLTKTTHADGTSSTTAYDLAGQATATTDERGNSTQYQYDLDGRRTKVTNALGFATNFAYDLIGNQTAMTDANGNTTQYLYDGSNRRTRVIYPDNTFHQTDYDALGRSVRKVDQARVATQYVYDSLGRLTQVTDALSQVTRYGYDELGNRISQMDANNHTTLFEYDKLGRRTKRTLPLGMSETSAYNAAGNQVSKTDFNGKTTTYTYDVVNRLTSEIPDAALNEPTVSFSYLATGQRSQMIDASGTTTYQYDSRDRLLQKVTPEGTLTYTYDAAGNESSIRSSNTNGAAVDYAHDGLNRLKTVTDQRLAAGSNTTTYTYDSVGNLQGYVYPNGLRATHTYNALNRLGNLAIDKSGSALAQYVYTLGPSGNRATVSELSGRRVGYSYDSLYRLTDETIASSPDGINDSIHYVYDPVGNRLTRTSMMSPVPSATYAYDPNDRLATDIYDANGNTINSGTATYTYDFQNRLETQNGTAVSIIYDGDGNRVAKTVAGITTRYLVDDRNLTGYAQVLEEIQTGSVQRVYTYGLNRISQSQASGTSFYGYDGQDSVRLLTDVTGTVTDRYDYDAFGVMTSSAGTTVNAYRYAGEQLDPNLGFYYLGARYYLPEVGRFITMDRILGSVFDPGSLHRYLYVQDNPVNFVDPSGNEFTLASLSASVSVVSILSSISISHFTFAILTLKTIQDFWEPGFAAHNGAVEIISATTDPAVLQAAFDLYNYGNRLVAVGSDLIGLTGAITGLAQSSLGLAKSISGLANASNIIATIGNSSSLALQLFDLSQKAAKVDSAASAVVSTVAGQPVTPGLLSRLRLPSNELTGSLIAALKLAAGILSKVETLPVIP